ncbi:MAG: ABC transporter substrate-binding protein [Acidimicrobiaceae bacterium]|nr:ABC transporter substrate-binding protein [Acidimicrobiaceae bacterium]MYC42386.1 ABC transporter substrate-binding protein [Acidimicrobiaceae bacterium]
MLKVRFAVVLLVASALVAAGCGNDDAPSDSIGDAPIVNDVAGESEEDPTAVQSENADSSDDSALSEDSDESAEEKTAQDSPPQRIVSLSPSATEILFAIGAGPQVVAVDSYSYYPPEAPVTDLSGWDPNVEAVTAYEPDLVVISTDSNDLLAGLSAVGVPVLVSPAPSDIEGGYGSIAELGEATGHLDGARVLIEDLRSEIETALANAPEVSVRVYHELGESYFSASSASFIGAVYAAMGATNIADGADPDGIGFPQLTEEYIIESDPELIVITDQVAYTREDVLARPGWGEVTAIENNNVVVVNADIASRWGPRLPQFIAAVVDALSMVDG